jgi:serine/threonine protein kinase
MHHTISHYRILEKIGEGGMGVVYRAEDTKLGRNVAMKLLSARFSAREDFRIRMLREARTAAALNQSNICTIHEVGELQHETTLPDGDRDMVLSAGTPYIVMELLRGQTLHALLSPSGPLPVKDALEIAVQVAEGLAEAHSYHIVHRDLKPQNVMVDVNGRVKILDFGLAKPLQTTEVQDEVMTLASTQSDEMTRQGHILGTVAYMSPEQAVGTAVDSRSDVFSFGTMLYEMTSGQRPFQGQTATGTLAKILEAEPPTLSGIRPGLPSDLERIILRCLQKKPADRYNDTRDLVGDLKQLRQTFSSVEVARRLPASGSFRRYRWLWASAGPAVILAAIVVFLNRGANDNPSVRPASYKQITFTGDAGNFAVSPDGQFLTYTTGSLPDVRVIVHDLANSRTLEVFRGPRVTDVRWSPNGANLLVATVPSTSDSLKIIPRLGGSARSLTGFYRASWSPDGSRIVWINPGAKRLFFTNVATGEVKWIPLTQAITFMYDVDWSPKGDWILFQSRDEANHAALWIVKPDGSEQQKLIEEDSTALSGVWAPAGDVIYYLKGDPVQQLWKLQISAKSGKVQGVRVQILNGLESGLKFTVFRDGKRMAYLRNSSYSNLRLALRDGPYGAVQIKELTVGTLVNSDARFSPDGNRIAFSQGDGKKFNIFVLSLDGHPVRQLTFMNATSRSPVWSPDGRTIAFASDEGGSAKVWTIASNGGAPRLFSKTNVSAGSFQLEWSPAHNILYHRPGNRNFYILNPLSETESPLVKDDSIGWIFSPFFSLDGTQLVVMWNRLPGAGLYVIPFEGSVPEEARLRVLTGKLTIGNVTQSVDAAPYRGKQVKLSADVKANVKGEGNAGQCWMRVDRTNKQTGFSYNMDDMPITSASWSVYEIIGKVDSDADKIFFGCFLRGTGEVSLTDFELSVRNDANAWTPIAIQNPSFEEDADGSTPSGWSASSLGYSYRVRSSNRYKGKKSVLISAVPLPEGQFFPIGWSSNGTQVYAVASENSRQIVAIPARGGESKPIMTLPVPDGQMVGEAAITPDARSVVFSVFDSKSDIWMIDNFDPSIR